MNNRFLIIANTIRRECFNTTGQRIQTVSCLASSLALGATVGIGSASVVGVTFCMLVVLSIVSGITGSDSPVFGPACAAIFGLSGYVGLASTFVLPQAVADSALFIGGVSGGVAAVVWWATQMAAWVVRPLAGGSTQGRLKD